MFEIVFAMNNLKLIYIYIWIEIIYIYNIVSWNKKAGYPSKTKTKMFFFKKKREYQSNRIDIID
jgi:hypothetical protein